MDTQIVDGSGADSCLKGDCSPKPVREDALEDPNLLAIEIYVRDRQRYWVDLEGLMGIRLKGGVNGSEVLGIVYDQIEDAQNPFSAIYSLFLTLECMNVDPSDRPVWCQNIQDFDGKEFKNDLLARVREIYDGLRSGAISFLGLNLDNFKTALTMMMTSNGIQGGIDTYRIPQGDEARMVFFGTKNPNNGIIDDFLTCEACVFGGGNFFYYPDGSEAEPMVNERLAVLQPKIDELKKLDANDFIVAIFEDLLGSVKDGEAPIEDSPRYQGASQFARCIYQKIYAIHYAIRSCLEEDKPIFLNVNDGGETTLGEIKRAIVEARERRRAGCH